MCLITSQIPYGKSTLFINPTQPLTRANKSEERHMVLANALLAGPAITVLKKTSFSAVPLLNKHSQRKKVKKKDKKKGTKLPLP